MGVRIPVVLAVMALAAGSLAPAATAGAPPGALFGAYVQAPGDDAAQRAAFEQRERDLGHRFGIDHRFYAWDEPFPTAREIWDLQSGRVPLISWQGALTLGIELGLDDELIRAGADAVRALPGKVFIRWMWQMDSDPNEADAVHPDRFIAAWRHIHDVFRARGATNVAWVWCPRARAFSTGEADLSYPGDDYVDWTCADGYNRSARPKDGWLWFDDIFSDFYLWGMRRDKPMMIGEFGADERGSGEKAVWLRDAYRIVRYYFPAIKAVVYLDGETDRRWGMDTSPESLRAFSEWLADPYFRTDPKELLGF